MFFNNIIKSFKDRNCINLICGLSSQQSSSMSKTAALIFLHGLGDKGESWNAELQWLLPPHIKCICPTAPVIPVTLNAGTRMTSWFDIISLSATGPEDADGIKKASTHIHQLIEEQEKAGIPHDRIMLGGFSQGGALALYSALRYPKKLAGVLALSCWIPLNGDFPAAANDSPNKTIPIMQCHGTHDIIVPLAWGEATKLKLQTFLGDNYKFKTYAHMGHSSCSEELKDAKNFIVAHLKPN